MVAVGWCGEGDWWGVGSEVVVRAVGNDEAEEVLQLLLQAASGMAR